VVCPQGTTSRSWHELVARSGHPYIMVSFSPQQCRPCPVRSFCTQSRQQGRRRRRPPQAQYEALQTARAWDTSDEAQQHYKRRAGGEGTLSQGGRACGRRRTRTVAWSKRTDSTSPSPLRSISTALWRGWRSAHEPQRGRRALQHWRLCLTCPRSPLPSAPLTPSSLELFSNRTVFCYCILQKSFL
jgi:hypothetical protein